MTTIPPGAAEDYRRDRYVVLPRLLTPETAARLWSELAALPARRVTCGHEAIGWHEQTIASGETHALLQSPQIQALVHRALDLDDEVPLRLQAWTSIYARGEFIDPHRDTTGAVQLLIALDAPPESNGGQLVLRPERGEVQLTLRPGDGVLFEARAIEHCTTPLRPTAAVPEPTRVVAVGRYHLPTA